MEQQQQQGFRISQEQAITCCASHRFAQRLAAGSPCADFTDLVAAARHIWWRECGVTDWLEAFAAHPKIGDRKGSEGKPAAFTAFSAAEQSTSASTLAVEVEEALQSLNQAYLERHGFIFIICAKGRPAPEILGVLKARIERTSHEEIQAAAQEQMKITELRLGHVFGLTPDKEMMARMQRRADQVLNQVAAAHATGPLRSPITTHVLDSALGCPAHGLPLSLHKLDEHSQLWDKVSEGVTNADGRVGDLLPLSNFVAPGRYRMYFNTSAYLALCKAKHPGYYADVPFYPEVTIDFEVTADKATQHYHIPLLLSPYSYSTYRGS
mmetsp:Transcript_9955/g.17430  ORF Transcript_9955/g.17430 Transcript_9955/m.17430 type:complete len:324 (-) Transcript_9955:527-1498(-)